MSKGKPAVGYSCKKQELQLFSSYQKTFIFCDFDWESHYDFPSQSVKYKRDIYFQEHKGIYVWECGLHAGQKIIDYYFLYGEEFTEHITFRDSSFVLYDSTRDCIIAVRDFMGNYPLYYYKSPDTRGNFIFTFSMNALVQSKLFDLDINYAKVVEYIECDLNTYPNNYTFYQHVFRLLPAYIVCIRQGTIEKLTRYGKFDLVKYQSFTDAEYIEHFKEFFVKSVKKNTDTYEKIAASLSGGLDSSAVCSVAQSLRSSSIFTFNFKPNTPEAQEDEYIDAVVAKWHNIHQTVKSACSGYEAINTIIEQNAQPHFVFNYTIQLNLIKAARQEDCDVFLSGHWGDQVVGYGTQYIEELAFKKDWENVKKAIEQNFRYSLNSKLTSTTGSVKNETKATRLYAIRLLWANLKTQSKWTKLPSIIWILINYFNCGLGDFFTIVWQRINRKKRISSQKIDGLICPDVFLKNDEIRQEYPPEILDRDATVDSPVSVTQKKQLDDIFKGNQTYGQEEYFEIYRQNSLRSAQPFFDSELLELSLSIPSRIKFDEGRKRGTLRKALKDYLPEKVANRTTKAVFTDHYVTLFKVLYKEFDAKTPDDHPIWKIVNKPVFDEKAKILLDDLSYLRSRYRIMPPFIRIINLAIWLNYLEELKK